MYDPLKKVLKALSEGDIEVKNSRRLANIKKINPMKMFYNTLDYDVVNGETPIPTRVYFPQNKVKLEGPVFLFFHGGGWVTESVDNYDRSCLMLAQYTGGIVISVEYRLAPEYPFPAGLNDCYAVANCLFKRNYILNISPEKIILIGDSAGGNLVASICQMARDRGDFIPKAQILIYPATYNDYSEASPFPSVKENGKDYFLTAKKMQDYLDLYEGRKDDRNNPYFAPLLAENFVDLPRALVLTAQLDPLRDEGEAYGRKMEEAGVPVTIHRIDGAIHGYFALGIRTRFIQETFEYIKVFVEEEITCVEQRQPIGEN